MTTRLSDYEVERELGQTPCLCGCLTFWHFECYRGKSDRQIKKEMASSMNLARAEVMRRRKEKAACGDRGAS